MWSTIEHILESPAGSFASVFAVLSSIGLGLFHIGRVVEKFTRVDRLDAAIQSIKNDIAEIRGELARLGRKSKKSI